MTANFAVKSQRVLVLTSTFPRWEGDHEPPFVFELSKRLGEQFEVIVLAPHAPNAKLTEKIGGIEVHRFRYFFPQWQGLAYEGGILANLKKNRLNYFLVPLFVLSEFISLVRLLRQTRIDVIHAHWLIPQGLVALTARAFSPTQPAILCTSHGGDLFGLSGQFFALLKRQVIRQVDKLTVVSHAMREHAACLAGRRDIEVIPMGVDLFHKFSPSQGTNRNPYELLFAGRLVEKKGVRYLILAMPEILKTHPKTILRIAGDGPEKSALQQLTVAKGLEAYVQFLGAIDNASLQVLYRQAAIFVAPSVVARGGDQEGLGLVFVEALGCACPVIASDLPAIQDVVLDGITGLVCRQKDSVYLAEKIRYLLDNPEVGVALGQAGRQHVVKSFDWKIIAKRYQELIANLGTGKQ